MLSVPQISAVPPPSNYGTGAHGTLNGGMQNTMTGTVIRPGMEVVYSDNGGVQGEIMMGGMQDDTQQLMIQGEDDMALIQQQQVQTNQQVEHIPLAKTRVLYLGSAVPIETANGLEAVQLPLRERYSANGRNTVEGIDTWLSVFSSGLVMQYVGDKESVTWWPISSLHVCAAVKAVTQPGANGEPVAKFVALDSDAGKRSQHPPMFAAIMRRTKGIKILECHAFICKSDQAAMALVQSCTHAFEHKELWTNDQPPEDLLFLNSSGLVRNYNIGGEGQTRGMPPPGPRGPMLPPPPGGMPPPGPMMPPPQAMLGPPVPFMPMPPPGAMMPLPPPPAGYFADWDDYGGRPVQTFPPPPPMPYETRRPTRPPERRPPPPPRDDYYDDDEGSVYSEYYYERRPRDPPADYRDDPYAYDRQVTKYREPPRDDYYRDDYRDSFAPPRRDDYRDSYDPKPSRDQYDRFDREDDLVLYAPRYKRDFY